MYFTLITAEEGAESSAAHQRMDGPYADHQWLWQWFKPAPDATRDFLFRRDDGGARLPRFYLLSAREPLQRLRAWNAMTRRFAPVLEVGDVLTFSLRANPTVRRHHDGKPRRHDVLMDAKKQLLMQHGLSRWSDWSDADRPSWQSVAREAGCHWLAAQGRRHGFEPELDTISVDAYQQHRESARGDLQFSSVDFSGRMTVTDAAACEAALRRGIGRAKAFGCGLLLVRRAQM